MGKKTKSLKEKVSKEKNLPTKVEDSHSIHIRLENSEAVQGKRDLLSSEINLLKIFQSIENFKRLRSMEVKKKKLILKKSKEIKTNLSKLGAILPGLKIPKILKKEVSQMKEKKEKLSFEIPKKKGNIEEQLLEIQERLNRLPQ